MMRAVRAVLWGFFGVRRREGLDSDASELKPQHVIAAGLAGALAFVLALFGIVAFVTR